MTVEDGMSNGSSAPKVRKVKCPKCRQVLQESADIPIYMCGGCGIILQAKHRKSDGMIVVPNQQKSNELPPKEMNNASEDKDPGSLTCDVRIPSSAENSVDFEEPIDRTIGADPENFMPKEEMPVWTDGDRLDVHDHSIAAVNGTRDEERTGIHSLTELESRENGGLLPIDERNSESEASREGSSVPHEDLSEETKGSGLQAHKAVTSVSSSVADCVENPPGEITTTDAPFQTGALEERFNRTSPRVYDRRISMDTTVSTEYVDPVSEFSSTLAETPRSLAGNFHRHHLGDLPNYDARETLHLNRYGKEAKSAVTRERLGQEKYQMKYSSEIQHPEMNSRAPLSSSHEDSFIRAGGRVRTGMLEPPARGSQGSRYWRRPDKGELPPRIPANLQQRSYYDYGSSSNQVPMYSRCSSGIHSSDALTHPEHEKMKLLRMVHELEDQLKRTCDLEGVPRERMLPGSHWREKHGGFYYSRGRIDEDYSQMGLPAYSRADERDSRWRYHSRYAKRPFSAEMAESTSQLDNFYHHPADWRRSAPLPPLPAAHNRKFYGIRNDKSNYSPYSSSPSTPQRYMDYGFLPYGYDTRSDDEIYDKEKEYVKYKEAKPTAQRRVRAAAGGAPWIVCSHCTRLLQLPTDFLLFKKKCHRLRCGSCSSVLKFSLKDSRQMVPYVRHAEAPPPSEADERGDSLRVNTPPPLDSHLNGFTHAEMVSYSDDIDMSYSTERGDPLDESLEKAGSSPLHRLMGYSSVSQVFRGPEPLPGDVTSSPRRRQ